MGWSQFLNTAAQVGTGLIARAQTGQQISPGDFVGALIGGLTSNLGNNTYGNMPYGATPPFVPQQGGYPNSYFPQSGGNVTQLGGMSPYQAQYGNTMPYAGAQQQPVTTFIQRVGQLQSYDGQAGVSVIEFKGGLEAGLAAYGRSAATSSMADILMANGLGTYVAPLQAYLASAEGQALAGHSAIDQATYAFMKLASGNYTGVADISKVYELTNAASASFSNITSPTNALGNSALGSTLGSTLNGLGAYQNILGGASQVPASVQQLLAQYYPNLASQILGTSSGATNYSALFNGAQNGNTNSYLNLFGLGQQNSMLGGSSTLQNAGVNQYLASLGLNTQSPLNSLIGGASQFTNFASQYPNIAAILNGGTNAASNMFGLGQQVPGTAALSPAVQSLIAQYPQYAQFFNGASSQANTNPFGLTNTALPGISSLWAGNTAATTAPVPITLTGDALIAHAAQVMMTRVQGQLVNGMIPNKDVFRALFAADATVTDELFNQVARWDGSISLDDVKTAIAGNLYKVGASAATLTAAQLQQWLVASKFAAPEAYTTIPGTVTGNTGGTVPTTTTTTAAAPTEAEKSLATTQSAMYWRAVADKDGNYSTASWDDMHNWIIGSIGANPTIEQVRQMFASVKMVNPATGQITLDEAKLATMPGATMAQKLATYFIQRNDRTTTTQTGVTGQGTANTVGSLDQTEFTALWYANPTPCTTCVTKPPVTPLQPIPTVPQPTTRTVIQYVPVPVPGPTVERVVEKVVERVIEKPSAPVVNNNSNTQSQNQQQTVNVYITKKEKPVVTKTEPKPEPLPQPKSGQVFETFGDPKFDLNGDDKSDFEWKEDFTVNVATSDGKFVPIKMDSVPNKSNAKDDLPSMMVIPLKGDKPGEVKYLEIKGIANDTKSDKRDGALIHNGGKGTWSLEDAKSNLGGFNQIFEDKDKGFLTQDGKVPTGTLNPTSKTSPADKLDASALFELVDIKQDVDPKSGKGRMVVTLKQGNDTYTLTIHELNNDKKNEAGQGQTTVEMVRTLGAPVMKAVETKEAEKSADTSSSDDNIEVKVETSENGKKTETKPNVVVTQENGVRNSEVSNEGNID